MARVLVTGCSTGIGRASAIELTARGHEVVATARRLETLDDLDVKERLALDVTSDESVRACADAAGPIDALVNNAGIGIRAPVETAPLDEVRRIFETNVFGVIRMIQAFLPGMRERGNGVIVNVSSVAGRVGLPLSGYYSASKFSVEALSEVLRLEAGHFGVRVVAIEPGYIETAFTDNVSRFDIDGPYGPLYQQTETADEKLLGGPRPGPDIVAKAIADAIDDPDTPLRVPVGADAEMAVATRAALDDAQFEEAVRATLGLDW